MERWRGKRRCISSLSLMQVHPWMDCKRAVCHLLSCRLFSAEKRGGKEKKKPYSLTDWPCCSFNGGPGCIRPPPLPWPTPKSHRVIKLHYCSKTSVAHRPSQHIHHVARERVGCSRPPWILPIRMTVNHVRLSHRWRWQRSQYRKEEVPPQRSDPDSIKTDEESEIEDEHRGAQKQSSHPNRYLSDNTAYKSIFLQPRMKFLRFKISAVLPIRWPG